MTEDREQKLARIMSKATEKKQDAANDSSVMVVSSQGVVAIGGDNSGDINVNVTKQTRTSFTPGEQHITPATALKIKDLVTNLVDKEVASGKDRRRAFSQWWSYLNRTYGVTTYREIPRDMGEDAIAWLQQNAARTRSKIRRRDTPKWRSEHYTGIWARAKQRDMTKADVYKLCRERLDKNVSSLKNLSDQNLKRLYQIVMKL